MSDSSAISPHAEPRRSHPQARRALISGASGFVGSHLVEHLGKSGYDIVRLVRRPPTTQTAAEIPWDPVAGNLDAARLGDLDVVINLSGENIAGGRWNDAMKKRIRDSRLTTTRLLSETMAGLTRRPRLFVCASAVGYYGNRGEEVLTEHAPPGSGFLADVCREWEAASEPARSAGIRVVNLRMGVILSPKGGALARMLTPFGMGLGGVVGSGNQWVSWIALSDLIQVFEFALTAESLQGPVNAVSPEPVTNRLFTKTLGAILKRPTVVPMPAAAVRLTLGEMGVQTLLASARVVPERLESAGFRFRHPHLDEALRFEMARR